jgi:nitrite reductase (NO-forming)
LAFVLTVLAAFAVPALSSASVSAVSVVKISAAASGLRYDQKTVHARAGRIKVVFLNRSAVKHNVNIENGENELGKTATITHATTTMFVTLKRGTYNFYCSVPGHEAAGMHGTLIVS